MKKLFSIMAVIGLTACQQNQKEIKIMGCCNTADQVDAHPTDSTDMFGPYPPGEKDDPIDTLQNVGELLDYLETIPSISY